MENLPRMDKRGYRLVGTLINIYSGERLFNCWRGVCVANEK